MRIIASADHHFDESRRWEECLRVHAWMAEEVARQSANLFVSCGDVYDGTSTPRERSAVADWLTRVAETCPVLIVKGNHDRLRDLALLTQLRTRHPIFVEEACGIYEVAGAAIAAVAWPSSASIATMLGRPLPSGTVEAITRTCYQDVLRGLGDTLSSYPGPRVLVTHAMIHGARNGLGQPLIGQQLVVGREELGLARADITIAGHVHMPQHFDHGGRAILYTGSPFRNDFGEIEEKSLLRIDFDVANRACGCERAYPRGSCPECPNRGVVRWERIPTPARPMVRLVGAWQEGSWKDGVPGVDSVPAGADIRFRYTVSVEEKVAAWHSAMAIRGQLLQRGAASVKLEMQLEPSLTPRAPIALADLTTGEKLRLLWKKQNTQVSDQRAEVLLARLAELEEDDDDSVVEVLPERGAGAAHALAAPLGGSAIKGEGQEVRDHHAV